jgi:FAD:protein FMN transferase
MIRIIISICCVGLVACKESSKPFGQINGQALGKEYAILYHYDDSLRLRRVVDSTIQAVTAQLNSQSGMLSRINAVEDTISFTVDSSAHLKMLVEKSIEYVRSTQGALNAASTPLYNFYGSGYSAKKELNAKDSIMIASLLPLTDMRRVSIVGDLKKWALIKQDPKIQLSFAPIEAGYIVDLLTTQLEKIGVRNYMISLGGKVRAQGVDAQGKTWTYGLQRPKIKGDTTTSTLMLSLNNKGLASSGDYSSGAQYAYVIDHKTGMSKKSNVLGVTVIAPDCLTADAYATAFINMGVDAAIDLIPSLKNVQACFVYDLEGDGNMEFKLSEGFSKNYYNREQ